MDSHRDQEMTGEPLQRAKFALWNFARKHPALGVPIRALGRLSTAKLGETYRARLAAAGESILPPDRYERDGGVPTQLVLVTGEDASAARALALLFNHVRVPYRKIAAAEFRRSPVAADVTIFCGADAGARENFPGKSIEIGIADARRLLPWQDGLLSLHAAGLIERIVAACEAPFVTGMLPALAALRLDDIKGRGSAVYLPPLLERGWRPNLGLFLDDFGAAGPGAVARVSAWAREGAVEISPHAFAADEFLFFDYPRGKPFPPGEFSCRWARAKGLLDAWSLPLCESVNAHFHAVSRHALDVIAADGIRWHYGELTPDFLTRDPDPGIFPAGDPTCTTGQEGVVRRIYTGDTALDCNQPYSHYDFLMHAGAEGSENVPASRVLRRLKMALWCGFAAFVTTHEYLLNALPEAAHARLWNEVGSGLPALGVGVVEKVTLSELGRVCGDHTDAVIRSVRRLDGTRFEIELSGLGAGHGKLTIFWRGRRVYFKVPRFNGNHAMEIVL